MITGVEEMDERTGDPPGERGIGFQIRHRLVHTASNGQNYYCFIFICLVLICKIDKLRNRFYPTELFYIANEEDYCLFQLQ